MTTLTQAAPTVKTTRLEIKNATYSVQAIDPGLAGVAAVEVRKTASGESYAVVLEADGRATCECPDFVCRHEDHGTHCKHIRGVLAAGLLVAPAPRPAVAPVTPADVKRARYFGLTIPTAPVAVLTPVVTIAPGLVPVWDAAPAGDDESAGPIPADVDRWSALAWQLDRAIGARWVA